MQRLSVYAASSASSAFVFQVGGNRGQTTLPAQFVKLTGTG